MALVSIIGENLVYARRKYKILYTLGPQHAIHPYAIESNLKFQLE